MSFCQYRAHRGYRGQPFSGQALRVQAACKSKWQCVVKLRNWISSHSYFSQGRQKHTHTRTHIHIGEASSDQLRSSVIMQQHRFNVDATSSQTMLEHCRCTNITSMSLQITKWISDRRQCFVTGINVDETTYDERRWTVIVKQFGSTSMKCHQDISSMLKQCCFCVLCSFEANKNCERNEGINTLGCSTLWNEATMESYFSVRAHRWNSSQSCSGQALRVHADRKN